jgi:RNA polymerase sigma-70 factor (ECF subfamily)
VNQNDIQARFMVLYQQCEPKFSRFVLAQINNSDDAKDIVSESVTICWERFKKLNNPIVFKSYLYKVAINILKAYYRKKSKKLVQNLQENDFEYQKHENFATDILTLLKAKERVVATLFYVSEYNIKEIAEILNKSESNIKVILHRSRNRLKMILSTENDLLDIKKIKL